MIRVLLVDDHPVVRTGLAGMLDAEPDIEVVGAASGGEEAVRLAVERSPDIVLMDLRMPEGDGVSATAAVLAAVPTARVVVLTTYESDADIMRAIEAGATDYLLKDATGEQLVGAVRAAVRGETVLAPAVATRLVDRLRNPHPADALSPRELAVLRLVAAGQSNAQIGRALYIGESTVKTHLLRAFAKLGVSDRTAAVTSAISAGLLPADLPRRSQRPA
jgi:DNA-binding NarL/FixJ family response regulator